MARQYYRVKPMNDMKALLELESMYNVQTPQAFHEFIRDHNSGILNPAPYVWIHKYDKGFLFYEVVDFNKDNGYNTVYTVRDKLSGILTKNYIPFGLTKDKKGVFVIGEKSVYVCDTDSKEAMLVSNSFTSFYNEHLK